MSILNYLFIGFVFTFIVDLILHKMSYHPLLIEIGWDHKERVLCVLLWPLCFLVFIIAFLKSYFR